MNKSIANHDDFQPTDKDILETVLKEDFLPTGILLERANAKGASYQRVGLPLKDLSDQRIASSNYDQSSYKRGESYKLRAEYHARVEEWCRQHLKNVKWLLEELKDWKFHC